MATQLLSLAGWWFLPNLATSYAQPVLYRIFIRAGDPHPAPGSPRHNRDRKRIHTAVILLYLLYTIYEAEYQIHQGGNFYRMLSVPLEVTQKGLKSRWRRIAAQFHPDKNASGANSVEVFTGLQAVHDVLIHPAKRFAYDRFGPEVVTWQNCTLTRDYILQGLYQVAAYYWGSVGVLMIISWFGYMREGVFWRYYVMAAMFVLEVASATRPDFLPALSWLNTFLSWTGVRAPYLPYQAIILLRKVAITFFIALNQLGPVFQRDADLVLEQTVKGMEQQCDRMEGVAGAVEAEVAKLLMVEMVPFREDLGDFKRGVKGFLEANTVRNEKEVQGAIMEVLRKRREAQAGVVGS